MKSLIKFYKKSYEGLPKAAWLLALVVLVNRSGMMVVFFLGLGAASIAAGLVGGEIGMLVALAGIGLFAAIYHPVAVPWVMRSARGRVGTTLAINGIFGGLGIGLAGLVSGALIDSFGSRQEKKP